MCDDCGERIDNIQNSSAACEAKWQCPICGEQTFKKDADPAGDPANYGTDWSGIVFWVCVAAVLMTWVICAHSK